MHVAELAELAAIVATRAPQFVRAQLPIPLRVMNRYWSVSKIRLDRWGKRLRSAQTGLFPSPSEAILHQALAEEILASEVLTRVWTATVSAHDYQLGHEEAEPIVRSVYLSHQEARNRVLRWLIQGPHLNLSQLDSLNTLRRRMERWTDSLLAHLAPLIDIGPWVFDRERAADFTQDLADSRGMTRQSLELIRISLRDAVRANTQPISPSGDLHRPIASAIVSCFPAGELAAEEMSPGLWLERISGLADETQYLVDELHLLDHTPPLK